MQTLSTRTTDCPDGPSPRAAGHPEVGRWPCSTGNALPATVAAPLGSFAGTLRDVYLRSALGGCHAAVAVRQRCRQQCVRTPKAASNNALGLLRPVKGEEGAIDAGIESEGACERQ